VKQTTARILCNIFLRKAKKTVVARGSVQCSAV